MSISIWTPDGTPAGHYFVPTAATCIRIANEGCTDAFDLIILQLMKAGF